MKRTPLRKGKPRSFNSTLPRESRKRRKENVVRRKVVAEMREEHDGICPICRKEPAADAHEVLARSAGGSITDKANIELIGRNCHDWITFTVEGIRWATENGYRRSRHGTRS